MIEKLLNYGFSYRSFIFFFLYGVYVVLIEDAVVSDIRSKIIEKKTNYILGFILILMQVAEAYALTTKWKAIFARTMKRPGFRTFFAIWIFHSAVSLILTMIASILIGSFSPDKQDPGGLTIALMFGVIIKEIYILYSGSDWSDNDTSPISIKKEFISDGILFVYLCLAYSVAWKVMIDNTKSNGFGIFEFVYTSILFYLLYLPIVFGDLTEDMAYTRSIAGKARIAFALIFPLICMHYDRLS